MGTSKVMWVDDTSFKTTISEIIPYKWQWTNKGLIVGKFKGNPSVLIIYIRLSHFRKRLS